MLFGLNPSPPQRKLAGDIAYLEIKQDHGGSTTSYSESSWLLCECYAQRRVQSLYPSHDSCTSSTLISLLKKHSPLFRKHFSALLDWAAARACRVAKQTTLHAWDFQGVFSTDSSAEAKASLDISSSQTRPLRTALRDHWHIRTISRSRRRHDGDVWDGRTGHYAGLERGSTKAAPSFQRNHGRAPH